MLEGNVDLLEIGATSIKVALSKNMAAAAQVLKNRLEKNRVTQVYIKIGYPRKPRTTGDESQNHHLNGHVAQICQETGDGFDDVKMEIKRRAIKRGYPYRTDSFGNVVPQSEADCSTVECGYLIDDAHDVAGFLGIKPKEM